MQIQLSTEFALHGLLYLAKHQDRQPVQLAEIAASIKVKESYLRKLFQQLVKSEILEAYKGASGGYSLKLDPDQISFYDILKAMEGQPGRYRCYSSQRHCKLLQRCPIISGFAEAFDIFNSHLRKLTIASVLADDAVQDPEVYWLHQSALAL